MSCKAARAEAGDLLFGHPAGGDPGACACPEPSTHRQELAAELRRAFEAPTKLAAVVLAGCAVWAWRVSRRAREARR